MVARSGGGRGTARVARGRGAMRAREDQRIASIFVYRTPSHVWMVPWQKVTVAIACDCVRKQRYQT